MYQQFAIFSLNSSSFGRNSSKNVEKLKKILPKTQDFFPKTQIRGLVKICGELETCPPKKPGLLVKRVINKSENFAISPLL